MRIMELYRIESDYKNHKKRLQYIRNTNSKDKIQRITSQRFHVANQLKKIKLQDQGFQKKEEHSRREHAQSLMNRTLNDQFKKIRAHYEPQPTITPLNGKTLRQSPKAADQEEHTQLNFLKFKLDKMRSIYRKNRRHSQIEPLTKAQKARKSQREIVTELLKAQFKIESKVVFPRSKSKSITIDVSNLAGDGDIGSNRPGMESVGSLQDN